MTAGRPRLVVLVSGSGTNLQAVIDACSRDALAADVAAVVSNVGSAFALERARAAGIPTEVLPHGGRSRAAYDQELAEVVAGYEPDLVVLAGWMRILTGTFLSRFATINLHPAQPGAFPGVGAIEAAFEAWQRGEITAGGVMVHHVPDEGVDNGPVIVWEPVPFQSGDSVEVFTRRVHEVEHRLLVDAIARVLALDIRRSSPSPPPVTVPGR